MNKNFAIIALFLCRKVCRIKNDLYLCIALREKHFLKEEFGEVAEWSIAAVLKTVVLRGTRGSNPCLSAELTGQKWSVSGQKATNQ